MGDFNPFSLAGKTILVTGASSGIGKSIAITITRMGGRVVASGRSKSKLQQTMSLMEGERNIIVNADLMLQDEINRLASSVPDLDGVVHCAGIGHRLPARLINSEEIESVMKANFCSAALLQASLLANKKIRKGSSVVFIASKAAVTPSLGNSLYSASKGALISYARCLALEVAPRGIRVNCICPAMVWTSLILQNEVSEDQLRESEKMYPLKRYGTPEDVAYLAVYLLSDASSWMTGSSIEITGGANNL